MLFRTATMLFRSQSMGFRTRSFHTWRAARRRFFSIHEISGHRLPFQSSAPTPHNENDQPLSSPVSTLSGGYQKQHFQSSRVGPISAVVTSLGGRRIGAIGLLGRRCSAAHWRELCGRHPGPAWPFVPSPQKFPEKALCDVPEPSERRCHTCGTPLESSMLRSGNGGTPSVNGSFSPPCEGGWPRHQETVPFRKGADGVVARELRFAMHFETFARKRPPRLRRFGGFATFY